MEKCKLFIQNKLQEKWRPKNDFHRVGGWGRTVRTGHIPDRLSQDSGCASSFFHCARREGNYLHSEMMIWIPILATEKRDARLERGDWGRGLPGPKSGTWGTRNYGWSDIGHPPLWDMGVHKFSYITQRLYAVASLASCCKPRASISNSRILYFWILPLRVAGNSVTKRTCSGIL